MIKKFFVVVVLFLNVSSCLCSQRKNRPHATMSDVYKYGKSYTKDRGKFKRDALLAKTSEKPLSSRELFQIGLCSAVGIGLGCLVPCFSLNPSPQEIWGFPVMGGTLGCVTGSLCNGCCKNKRK